jgi:hypothetical protein
MAKNLFAFEVMVKSTFGNPAGGDDVIKRSPVTTVTGIERTCNIYYTRSGLSTSLCHNRGSIAHNSSHRLCPYKAQMSNVL